MKKSQATIKDIARELNIAPSTVSRALKDHYSISQKTKSAVLKLAKKLNYQPNAFALSLLNNRSNIIGLIIPEVVQPFYSSSISGIEDYAIDHGYNVIICQSNEQYERELNITKALISSRIDGLIVCHSTETSNFKHFKEIHNNGVPIVFYDRVIEGIAASKVVANDETGAFTITKHLILEGYNRIAHIAGPKHMSISKNRLQGYLNALKQYKIPIDKDLIQVTNLEVDDIRSCAQKLINLPEPPDAIFAVNDPSAIQVLQVLKSNGLKIPQDVAIAGFDNQPVMVLLDPPITTMLQPAYEMGQEAARLLLNHINDPNFTPETKTFETKLIVRESTANRKVGAV